MKYLALLSVFLAIPFLAACGGGRDVLSERELDQAWTAREEDKRPVVSDEDYAKLSVDARKLVIPQSLDDARHLARDKAKARQEGK